MPTALATPWPSGPVVTSTPAVWWSSGWPGVLRAPGAERLEVLELEAEAAEEELDVERDARVPARQHEPVAGDPVAGRRGRAASPSGRAGTPPAPGSSPCPGWPLPTFWTASMASTRTVSTALSSSSVQSRAGASLTDVLPGRSGACRAYPSAAVDSPRPSARSPPREREDPRDLRRPVGPAQAACTRRTWRPGRAGHVPRRGGGVRRPDQAARHRAAAADDRPGDVLRRRWRAGARPGRRHRRRRRASRPARPRSSTASTTATSTSRCAAPAAGRCRATSSPRAPRWSSASCSAVAVDRGAAACGSTRCRRCWSLAANAFYVFGYTMLLKRRTTQNIVWGGLAGCFPALIGWTAVTGELAWAPGRAVRGRVLLDAAAHLGAGAALPRGLRQRRRADAARGGAGPRGRPPGRDLQLGDGGGVAAAVAGRRHRPRLPGRRGRARCRVPARGAPDVGPHPGHRGPRA